MDFLRRLRQRGLSGVEWIISDAHEGLKAAIAQVFTASWQRCRVHFLRNLLARVPKTRPSLAGTLVRQVFIQPGAKGALDGRNPQRGKMDPHPPTGRRSKQAIWPFTVSQLGDAKILTDELVLIRIHYSCRLRNRRTSRAVCPDPSNRHFRIRDLQPVGSIGRHEFEEDDVVVDIRGTQRLHSGYRHGDLAAPHDVRI